MSKIVRTDFAQLRSDLWSRSLLYYMKTVFPWFVFDEIHCVIAAYLEAIAQGNLDRLMISMPPRAGKSTMASIAFPSWWMGKFPTDKIMQVGYGAALSKRFSRQTLGTIRSPQYQKIFPNVRLSKDAQAVAYWNIEDITQASDLIQRGEYQAAGVSSGIAGSGFNLGILDDPQIGRAHV